MARESPSDYNKLWFYDLEFFHFVFECVVLHFKASTYLPEKTVHEDLETSRAVMDGAWKIIVKFGDISIHPFELLEAP